MSTIKAQAKEIANQVIHSQKPLTFKINQGNDKSILSLIDALKKLKVEAEIVSLGADRALYVSPSWEALQPQEKVVIDIPEKSPILFLLES